MHDDTMPGRAKTSWRAAAIRLVIVSIALSCVEVIAAHGQRYVEGDDPEFPRVVQPDSLVTLNDRCIVRKKKLETSIRPVYVNLHPIGFC